MYGDGWETGVEGRGEEEPCARCVLTKSGRMTSPSQGRLGRGDRQPRRHIFRGTEGRSTGSVGPGMSLVLYSELGLRLSVKGFVHWIPFSELG